MSWPAILKAAAPFYFWLSLQALLLLSRQQNWQNAKRILLAGAALLTLAVGMTTALNFNLWYTPGVVANSEGWLMGGVPAHWLSLLVIAILFTLLYFVCAMLPTVIAFKRQLEDRSSICKRNIAILLIPGAFVMAPALFFDTGSFFVMMFWSAVFTSPGVIAEIPTYLLVSIAVWSALLFVFAISWANLFVEAIQQKHVESVEEVS